MIVYLFETRDSGTGKGLFAKTFIPKGTIVSFECDKDKYYDEEYFKTLKGRKKVFFLKYNYRRQDNIYVSPNNISKYQNHSCNSNILDSRLGFEIVVRDINKGEEATCDYRIFNDLEEQSFKCQCRSKNCCEVVNCTEPKQTQFFKQWDQRIFLALKKINQVNQPIKNALLIKNPELNSLFETTRTSLKGFQSQEPITQQQIPSQRKVATPHLNSF